MIHPNLKWTLRWLLSLFFVYSLARFAFLLNHFHRFSDAGIGALLEALLFGLRFDASLIFSVNLVFLVLALFPASFALQPKFLLGLRWALVLGNLPFLAINLVDIDYFAFTGKRTSFPFWRMQADVWQQIPQLALNFWRIPVAIVFSCFLIWRGSRFLPKASGTFSWAKTIPLFLFTIGISILMIRNSFQLKPLLPGHAFDMKPSKLGHVALNTPFILLKNLERQPVEKLNYMSEEDMQKQVCVNETQAKAPNQMNVVILLVESLSSEYMAAGNTYSGYTPFVDSLAKTCLHFTNHFANGRTSIDAVPAILLGVPRLMTEEFAASGYENNDWFGLGHQLKQNGYQTAFFHGGKNGTMSFDFLSKLGGMEKYYGMSEYPNTADYDGNWGIFDLPFLQFSATELNQLSQPFGAMIFTLSSHQPYTIPEPFKGRFPKGTLDIHESLGYADHSLRNFFKVASSMPWYANTLFVITGDHTQMTDQQAYQTPWGYYDVPLIFFQPGAKYPSANSNRFCQHADIGPSILDVLGIMSNQKSCIGRSVFGQSKGLALNLIDGKRSLLADSQLVQISETGQTSIIPFLANKTVSSGVEKANKDLLKAHLQYFNNSLLNNQWYKP